MRPDPVTYGDDGFKIIMSGTVILPIGGSCQVILDNSSDGDGPKPKNIAERLKAYAQHEAFYMRETLEEAADEIEKLRAALKPFAEAADIYNLNDFLPSIDEEYTSFQIGLCRSAAAALKEASNE